MKTNIVNKTDRAARVAAARDAYASAYAYAYAATGTDGAEKAYTAFDAARSALARAAYAAAYADGRAANAKA